MNIRTQSSRATEIARARARLERSGWPRLQMSVIVLVTAAVGLLASYLFRAAGVDAMVARYPLAILVAYAVFLLLMFAWTHWRPDVDVLDVADVATSGDGWLGGGGRSGGGGASSSWGLSGKSSPADSALDVVDGELGLSLLGIVALAAVAIVAVIAAGWVVWSAPVLMAELLVDAAIAGGLYRRMRGMQSQGWWWLCVRHTFWPLLGVVAFFAALGGILQHFVPEATTLMEAVRVL